MRTILCKLTVSCVVDVKMPVHTKSVYGVGDLITTSIHLEFKKAQRKPVDRKTFESPSGTVDDSVLVVVHEGDPSD